jgi:hypothetical protein
MKLRKKVFSVPPDGAYAGFIADVVDLGKVKSNYGEKEKVRIVYLLVERDPKTNKQYQVSEFLTQSLDERSNLFKRITSVIGKEPEDGYDTETLVGRQVMVETKQTTRGGKTYANVAGVAPAGKGQKPVATPLDFERKTARPAPAKANGGAPAGGGADFSFVPDGEEETQ